MDIPKPRSRRASREDLPSVVVTVPDGCCDGDEFIVEYDGRCFDVTVPAGCYAGVEIEVVVPPLKEAQAEDPQELVGQRAMVCGLISCGVLNGKKGSLRSYDADKGLFKLEVDGMYPYVSIRRENLLPLPWEEEPDSSNNEEPLEAPRAGLHYVGDRVLVERSNGEVSTATLVEYDEVFETFTVDVGRGVLKYGVEESYIRNDQTSSQWVGPSRRVNGAWEGFFGGRRVRLPEQSSLRVRLPVDSDYDSDDEEDDRNGEIRGYDARSECYVVQMDNGTTRSNVQYGDVKVLYKMRSYTMA